MPATSGSLWVFDLRVDLSSDGRPEIWALITYFRLPELLHQQSEVTIVKNPGGANMEIIKMKGLKIEKYRATSEKIGGEGEKLGTAYRLKNSEVVYVPEGREKK